MFRLCAVIKIELNLIRLRRQRQQTDMLAVEHLNFGKPPAVFLKRCGESVDKRGIGMLKQKKGRTQTVSRRIYMTEK